MPVGSGDDLAQHFGPYVDAGANLLNLFPAGDPELAIDEIALVAEALHAS